MAYIRRVDNVAALSEATRILVNLVKTVWKEGDEDAQELRTRLACREVAAAIIGLIRTTTFPLLKNDGAITMALLLTGADSKSLADGKKKLLAGAKKKKTKNAST